MAYSFDQVFAADPSNPSNVAANAAITIFAPGDGTMTPLTITDPDGQPLANPITVNANGFASAFAHATLDRVAWAGGGFTGFFTSYEGIKAEAVAARAAAEAAAVDAGTEAAAVATAAIGTATDDAEAAAASASFAAANASDSAAAAAASAALVGAPADAAIATAVAGAATATKAALDANYARVFAVEAAYGDGLLDATAHIQSKIDAANAAGGGVVAIPPGQFRLTRSDDIASVTLKSNVVLRGAGKGVTHLFLDPATPSNAVRYHVLRIGTPTVGADNIVIEKLKVTANQSVIGGGSILGIGARHTDNKLATSGNITVQDCAVNDSQIAICASKDGGDSLEQGTDRLAAQYSNWLVRDNVLDLCFNKMVEFSETNGARCVGNRMTRCYAGPQAIFFSRNIVFEKNYVNYTDSGMNIAAGAHDIDIIGNTFEAHSSINPGTANGAIFFRTEPTSGRTYDIHDIRSRGNVYRDKYTTGKRVMKFQTRTENTAGLYRLVSFIGDTFDGAIYFDDVTSPAKTTITEFLFSDCTIEGDFFNDLSSTLVSYTDNELRGNRFRKSGGYTLSASGWAIRDNRFKSALTVAAGATGNVIQNNKIVGGLTDNGTGTVSANNVTA